MNSSEKILLIGHGYWGKILEKNLVGGILRIVDASTHTVLEIQNELKDASHVLVATPATTHFDLVQSAIENNCKIFCEKPLTLSLQEATKIYENLLNKKDLYVDWLFLCNPAIRKIRELIRDGHLKNLRYASMNRLNLGPERSDVNARQDLASHDLSILSFLTQKPLKISYKDFLSSSGKMHDTSQLKVNWEDGEGIINVSWNYPVKIRTCIFEFENAIVHWDDFYGFLKINGEKISLEEKRSPLKISLEEFISNKFDFEENKKITLEVASLLDS